MILQRLIHPAVIRLGQASCYEPSLGRVKQIRFHLLEKMHCVSSKGVDHCHRHRPSFTLYFQLSLRESIWLSALFLLLRGVRYAINSSRLSRRGFPEAPAQPRSLVTCQVIFSHLRNAGVRAPDAAWIFGKELVSENEIPSKYATLMSLRSLSSQKTVNSAPIGCSSRTANIQDYGSKGKKSKE